MEITTRMEFDSGHRIPNHKSVCKNLHGHRYAIEVTVKGEIEEQRHQSDFGMVMDFKDAKNLIKKVIVDEWDHAFIAYEKDLEVISFLNTLDNHKTVILKGSPLQKIWRLLPLNYSPEHLKMNLGIQLDQ